MSQRTRKPSYWQDAPMPRHQIVLFQETLESRIPSDHPVRILDEVLNRLDWHDFEALYHGTFGQPPIHPSVLCKNILLGLTRSIRSSCQLEYNVKHSIDFIWLTSGRTFDHSTGHDFMRQQKLLFEHWRGYKSGEIDWRTFQNLVSPVREDFNRRLIRGSFIGNKKLIGFCDALRRPREWLWAFTEVEGIEPTNNEAERALRPAVIYRKLSFGTKSERGSRCLERTSTVSETCRRQRRLAYAYLVDATEASFANRPTPTLLPILSSARVAA